MGVRVRLREVSACRRLKVSSFSRDWRTAVYCPLMGGVRLREVSVSEGSTVTFSAYLKKVVLLKCWLICHTLSSPPTSMLPMTTTVMRPPTIIAD